MGVLLRPCGLLLTQIAYHILPYRPPSAAHRSGRSRNDSQNDSSSEDGSVEEVDRFPGSSPDTDEGPSVIMPMSSYKPALDVFVQRFVDAFSPEVHVRDGHAGTLRAAAGVRMFSPILTDAFEAVAVAYFGRSIQDKSIETAGFRLYPRVLHGLQQALIDPERSKAESTLVTVILLIAFEVNLPAYVFSVADPCRASRERPRPEWLPMSMGPPG